MSWRASVLLCVGALSCSAPKPGGVDVAAANIAPEFNQGVTELVARVNAHDDELARAMVANLLARGPDAETRAAIERLGATLRGRELEQGLRLELFSEPLPRADGETAIRRRLVLRAQNAFEYPVNVEIEAVLLTHRTLTVDSMGSEKVQLDSVPTDAFKGLEFEAGAPSEVEILSYEVPHHGGIAVRDQWRMETHPGAISANGESFVSEALEVAPAESILLAEFLPSVSLTADPLAEFVASEASFQMEPEAFVPPLMERAVRLAPSEQTTAVARLAELAPTLTDERLERIVPALRWVLRVSDGPTTTDGWRELLAQRASGIDAADDELRLTLPAAAPN